MTLNALSQSMLSDWIGSDNLARLYESRFSNVSQSYPPYDIVKLSDTMYSIDLAVAGFSSDEITVEAEGDTLTIVGQKKTSNGGSYLHKGISKKDFTRGFGLMENVEIREVTLNDGILSVTLEHVVPETKKKRTIAIQNVDSTAKFSGEVNSPKIEGTSKLV